MTKETKKELLKAYYYGYPSDKIAKVFKISEDEVNTIIEDNKDILEDLAVRDYGEA